MKNEPSTTHFGYQTVNTTEKQSRVREVFDSVASQYDIMNDLMSLGSHRLWKSFMLGKTGLRPGQAALDVAGGTGDISAGLLKLVGPNGSVCLTDINSAMLNVGRDRLLDKGLIRGLNVAQANAEKLPFKSGSFDCITIAFGLRNVTDKQAALESMKRCLKPGGKLLILEFSKPVIKLLEPVYNLYSFKILPALGEFVANDAASYQYLAESIRMHPDQEGLKGMMDSAGLEDCRYYNLSGGIVALHTGYKY
ncbi:MAG: bifunctional demethylmenaquinone methyltransferase/2-methoxy-6-polyprenyl-1,4-benzoquinol methylase UbiE [Chromatiales bacterium]|nr:bifunctional demethylmenaquinone methyltransferase/2-methoxy-6-polyprenyl-1,4-benzoquinol methylase UbiE [Chromatiales bacterium]